MQIRVVKDEIAASLKLVRWLSVGPVLPPKIQMIYTRTVITLIAVAVEAAHQAVMMAPEIHVIKLVQHGGLLVTHGTHKGFLNDGLLS